jgi:hypothetical protein
VGSMHVAIIADDLTGAADTAQMVAAVVRPLTISLRKMIVPVPVSFCQDHTCSSPPSYYTVGCLRCARHRIGRKS